MDPRRGERMGWLLGWSGAFVWVVMLAIFLAGHGRAQQATTGVAVAIAGMLAIVWFAPWRHPRVAYRWLITPVYVVFFAAVAWAVRVFGAERMGIHGWWSALILLPILLPYWTVGNRSWE